MMRVQLMTDVPGLGHIGSVHVVADPEGNDLVCRSSALCLARFDEGEPPPPAVMREQAPRRRGLKEEADEPETSNPGDR